mmetsp:Transcript_10535/g.30585  ORF Transcript_10535/g.30585 Transcript_10535/m.30585 type:complete len:205 (-) Transcript_10535:282-896(-)
MRFEARSFVERFGSPAVVGLRPRRTRRSCSGSSFSFARTRAHPPRPRARRRFCGAWRPSSSLPRLCRRRRRTSRRWTRSCRPRRSSICRRGLRAARRGWSRTQYRRRRAPRPRARGHRRRHPSEPCSHECARASAQPPSSQRRLQPRRWRSSWLGLSRRRSTPRLGSSRRLAQTLVRHHATSSASRTPCRRAASTAAPCSASVA